MRPNVIAIDESIDDYVIQPVVSTMDAKGKYTTVEYFRRNGRASGAVYLRSILSGGTTPQYTTCTCTYYAEDGVTATRTVVYTLAYNGSNPNPVSYTPIVS